MKWEGLDKFNKRIHEVSKDMLDVLDKSARDAAYFALRGMKLRLRKNRNIDTGRLWGSFRVVKVDPFEWGVGSNVKYMWPLEKGTDPHKVPLRAIWWWVKRKWKLNPRKASDKARLWRLAWGIKRSIEMHGTRPHPYIEPTLPKALEFFRERAFERAREVLKK